MRRRVLMSGLVVVNLMLAFALWAQPAATQSGPEAIFDCCETINAPGAFCCFGCCWFVENCDVNEDC